MEPPAAQAAAPPPVRIDPHAELKTRIHRACIAKLGPQLFASDTTEDLGERVETTVREELELDGTELSPEELGRVVREITDDILGFGPIEPLLRDDSVSEVMVNAFDRVYVERSGKIEQADVQFSDNEHVLRVIDRIVSTVGRRVDEASPMVDARLPDGSRVNAIIPPLSLKGPTLTIRKFSRDPYTIDNLIAFGTLTPKAAQLIAACVRGKLNVLISGGTGTGKTTTLNAVSSYVPEDERIVTIEDAAELQLQQEHVITLESRPAEHRGAGRDPHPRARPQRPAHAARPDHRRRGPRRRDSRHAAGDEHRPRRVAHDHPRQLPPRRPRAASRRSCSRRASTSHSAPSASRSRAPSTSSSTRRGSSTAHGG